MPQMTPKLLELLDSANPVTRVITLRQPHWQTLHTAEERGWIVADPYNLGKYLITDTGLAARKEA